jgi:hypothetical protein
MKDQKQLLIILFLLFLPFAVAAPTSILNVKYDSERACITNTESWNRSTMASGNGCHLVAANLTIPASTFVRTQYDPVEALEIDEMTLWTRSSEGSRNRETFWKNHLAATSPGNVRMVPGFTFPPGRFWVKLAMAIGLMVSVIAVVGIVRLIMRWLRGGCECWCCGNRVVDRGPTESIERAVRVDQAGNGDPIRNWNSNVEMVRPL